VIVFVNALFFVGVDTHLFVKVPRP